MNADFMGLFYVIGHSNFEAEVIVRYPLRDKQRLFSLLFLEHSSLPYGS